MDQGSAVEIMYPDLFKGLNLKTEDLTPYNSPLVSFEGKVIIPKGQVRLPVQTGSEMHTPLIRQSLLDLGFIL